MSTVTQVRTLTPSNSVVTDKLEKSYYWGILLECWNLAPHMKHFPGPNPTSMMRDDISQLDDDDFWVALKSDGVRYLLLLTTKPNSREPISIMIDRANQMYELEVWGNEDFFYKNCLLDGELVWNQTGELQFVIFDVVMLKGISCIKMLYSDRLEVIRSSLLRITDMLDDEAVTQIVAEEDKFCARHNFANLQLLPKMCVRRNELSFLWNNTQGSHRHDGLIFTRNTAHIHTGTSTDILKWKPSQSIDIKCYRKNSVWSFFVNSNTSSEEFDISQNINSYLTILDRGSPLLKRLEHKSECVIECTVTLDDANVTLIPQRERSDKNSANALKTVLATILNAKENIQIGELYPS